MRQFLITLICLLLAINLVWAGDKIKVGTIAGPESELMAVARDVALSKYDLTIQIIEFSDFNLPNLALAEGSLDANMFQHLPYLERENENHHYNLVAVASTFVYPMAAYSNKITSIQALPRKAKIAIPNDPTNEARALLLLQKAGLIKLRPGSELSAMPTDIISNPKQLRFTELDAAQLPRALPDVSLAVINTNFASIANLSPKRDGLLVEGKDSPYANIIAVRAADASKTVIKQLVKAFQSPEVVAKAQELFQDGAIPAW